MEYNVLTKHLQVSCLYWVVRFLCFPLATFLSSSPHGSRGDNCIRDVSSPPPPRLLTAQRPFQNRNVFGSGSLDCQRTGWKGEHCILHHAHCNSCGHLNALLVLEEVSHGQ